MPDDINYFLETIKHLRLHEEILLFANLLAIETRHEEEVTAYLEKEFQKESFGYPCIATPSFDPHAALWGAKTLYIASQLLLYRQHKDEDVSSLLPVFNNGLTASACLSADLTLRFLPGVLLQLENIDPDDILVALLKDLLVRWHYSAVRARLGSKDLDFTTILTDPCLLQLYADRVIDHQRLDLAHHPSLVSAVNASLGMFGDVYWSEFKNRNYGSD